MKQLELFETKIDYRIEYERLRDELEKYRKSQFAKISELKKMYQEISHDLTIIKMGICKGKIIP